MANKLKELVERMTSTITIGSIRQIAKVSLLESPKYFWTIPSSSSGKYHPVDELVKGGLVIHTLKALYVFETLAPSLNGLNENSPFTGIIEVRGADCIRCAILLHDTYKNGIENCGHTIHEHPLVAANELRKRFKEVPVNTETIAKLIESHMGKWTTSPYSQVVLPRPEEHQPTYTTTLARIVATCDFLAAQKTFLNVQAFRHFMCDEDGLNIPESCFPEWIERVCNF